MKVRPGRELPELREKRAETCPGKLCSCLSILLPSSGGDRRSCGHVAKRSSHYAPRWRSFSWQHALYHFSRRPVFVQQARIRPSCIPPVGVEPREHPEEGWFQRSPEFCFEAVRE